jgi:hypothetical protein
MRRAAAKQAAPHRCGNVAPHQQQQAGDGKATPLQQQQMDTWQTVQADRQTEPRVDAERPP